MRYLFLLVSVNYFIRNNFNKMKKIFVENMKGADFKYIITKFNHNNN